jgi:hypothetical protein
LRQSITWEIYFCEFSLCELNLHRLTIHSAGDAAHSFPPTGGLGLNSGLGDVHNLAYKLAAVHQGWGSSKLLESYGEERREVADVNSIQSVKNGKKIFSFLKALGTAGIDDPDEARKILFKSIHDPEKQALIEENVEAQREHFDNVSVSILQLLERTSLIPLQLELHIGYVYGNKAKPPHASHYKPKFVSGARLPHAWIKPTNPKSATSLPPQDISYVKELTPAQINSCQYSILDLCSYDSFTLLVGPTGHWKEKFTALQERFEKTNINLRLFVLGTDFQFANDAHKTLFLEQGGFRSGGGLLVRPDQHILLKVSSSASVVELEITLREHLGL